MMRSKSIRLGTLLGVPVNLDYSWFIIFILVTWTLASSYFPSEFQGWPTMEYWITGAVTAVLFFMSVLLHELGHSVVAMKYKIPVRKITLFIFGGVAQIGSEPPYAMAEFWIAIAGPIVSFMLAGMFGLLQSILTGIAPVLALAKYLAYINGTLGLFNLIPGFPLDGGRVFRAIVWGVTKNFKRATLIAANIGRVIAYLFILFGVFQMFRGNFGNGLWIAFIGWFLENAASSQVRQQRFQDLLAAYDVSQAMSRNFMIMLRDTTFQKLMDLNVLGESKRFIVVKDKDEMVGLLTPDQINQVSSKEWNSTTIGQKMLPIDQTQAVPPDKPLFDAIQMMDKLGVNQLPVIEAGNLLGILSRASLLNFLQKLNNQDNPQMPRKHFTPHP